jgi:hypothetical protein
LWVSAASFFGRNAGPLWFIARKCMCVATGLNSEPDLFFLPFTPIQQLS